MDVPIARYGIAPDTGAIYRASNSLRAIGLEVEDANLVAQHQSEAPAGRIVAELVGQAVDAVVRLDQLNPAVSVHSAIQAGERDL